MGAAGSNSGTMLRSFMSDATARPGVFVQSCGDGLDTSTKPRSTTRHALSTAWYLAATILITQSEPWSTPSDHAAVHVAEAQQPPCEDGQHECVHARATRRDHAHDMAVRNERAVEDRVVAVRCTHAHHVPRFPDPVPLAARGMNAWTIIGASGFDVSMPCSPR
jgi:hypothetical protein